MFLQLQANQKTQQDEIENRLKEIQQEVNMNNQYLFINYEKSPSFLRRVKREHA